MENKTDVIEMVSFCIHKYHLMLFGELWLYFYDIVVYSVDLHYFYTQIEHLHWTVQGTVYVSYLTRTPIHEW
jgi:hypothetical protein